MIMSKMETNGIQILNSIANTIKVSLGMKMLIPAQSLK